MKKSFYLLLLCVSFGYAQQTAAIESEKDYQYSESVATGKLLKWEDFKPSNGRMLATAIPCTIQNDKSTNTILISVICMQSAFNQFGVDKINDMILVASEKVRNSLRTDHQYNPKEIKMAYIPDSHDWSLTSSFTIRGEDGIVKEQLLAVDFDANGKFEVMKRIL
jgi:hypothetical protein